MKRLISLLTLLMALSVNAQTIHWITFIDTSDPTISECNKTSRNVLHSHFINVVNDVLAENGYKSEIHDYHGTSVTPQNCKKIVESLRCESKDIIMFYYIGHGAHGSNDSNPYPQLTLGSDNERMYIPLQWVHNKLKAKNPALLVTIGMCDNSYSQDSTKDSPMFDEVDIPEIEGPSLNASYGNGYYTETEKQAIQHLFLGYQGDIIVTSASADQHSYACSTQFGFMDLFTAVFVYNFETSAEIGELDWENLITDVKYIVHDNLQGKQTPDFKCNLKPIDSEPDKSQKGSKSQYSLSYGVGELIKQQVKTKIALLNDYISLMADKNQSIQLRENYKKKALNLFIANGESYSDDGIQKKGAIIETTSLYRKRPLRRLVKDYFDGLIHNKYSKVEISSPQVYEIDVSDLKKIGDNLYMCNACFEQIFMGHNDGKLVYSDRTRKNVKVYISSEDVNDGTEYILKLGDIAATDIKLP